MALLTRDGKGLGRELGRLLEVGGLFVEQVIGKKPPADLLDTGDALLLLVDVPGMIPGQVRVTVEGNAVVISGERPRLWGEETYRGERPWGPFRRRFLPPLPVDLSRIQAELKHGQLSIRMPKATYLSRPVAVRRGDVGRA